MARPGDVLRHPAFGAQIRFLQTSQDTDGQLLRVEATLPPRFSMPEHIHPRQEEQHEVVAGTLQACVGGVQRDYVAGERVIGPANVPHAWRNPSDRDDLRLVSEHRPVLHMEQMLESGLQSLATCGWTGGTPSSISARLDSDGRGERRFLLHWILDARADGRLRRVGACWTVVRVSQ